jgi:hypothetical protein
MYWGQLADIPECFWISQTFAAYRNRSLSLIGGPATILPITVTPLAILSNARFATLRTTPDVLWLAFSPTFTGVTGAIRIWPVLGAGAMSFIWGRSSNIRISFLLRWGKSMNEFKSQYK